VPIAINTAHSVQRLLYLVEVPIAKQQHVYLAVCAAYAILSEECAVVSEPAWSEVTGGASCHWHAGLHYEEEGEQ
jgi:hypothetical protein